VPKFSAGERRELTEWCVVQHAQGRSYSDIADEIAVDRHTVARWVQAEFAVRSEYRSVSGAREVAIATYEAVIREVWRRLRRLNDYSTSVPGLLNVVCRTQARIDRLTGVEAPIKYHELPDEIVITWDDIDNLELPDAEDP